MWRDEIIALFPTRGSAPRRETRGKKSGDGAVKWWRRPGPRSSGRADSSAAPKLPRVAAFAPWCTSMVLQGVGRISKPDFYSDSQHRLLFFALFSFFFFFLATHFQGRNLKGEITAKWLLCGIWHRIAPCSSGCILPSSPKPVLMWALQIPQKSNADSMAGNAVSFFQVFPQ